MTLERWLKENSPNEVAKLIGVDQMTARHWRRGKNFPALKNLIKLKETTGLSYEMIVKHFVSKFKRHYSNQ